ncbi:MAG: alanine--tRNA ligase, partial [Candidatus Colwellbacteria bacterium]|nr:alanine--tRNA ligase [Candidatus Colwellbacteria bacterium]
MKVWSHQEIREAFLEYFANHDHLVIGSSSLVPIDDPTLLLINSGMAPLKPFFTGEKVPPHRRLCNIQKCVRTNDIESVGDRHHLTFFEMMGNWSIGDYFKQEAIELAWRMICEVFKFDTSRIYVTVYDGDDKLPGIPPDDESRRVWEGLIPSGRIARLGAGSNFWGPAGTSGPCGPCTEVFFDRGENYGCGKSTCGLDCECGRFL